ncbi:MAG: hypothetical protein J6Y08_07805 [Clostridiales bacterium]|nr:hypothetical protein [Clostridiales bacterium]
MVINNLEVTGKRDAAMSLYSVVLTVRPRQKINRDEVIKHINEIDGVISADTLS